MARLIGGRRRRRLGDESVRLMTMAGALLGGVAVVAAAIWIIGRTGAAAATLAVTAFALVALAVGKLLADRALLRGPGGRRGEDAERLRAVLSRLPDSWSVVSEPMLSGAVVENLVIGPRGVFAVEIFRWLTRDTGSAFHEKVASDLSARASEFEEALVRLTNLRDLAVQPVFFCVEEEGVRVGDLLIHDRVDDLRAVGGVVVATPRNLEALLRTGAEGSGLRVRSVDQADVARLVRLFDRGGAAARRP